MEPLSSHNNNQMKILLLLLLPLFSLNFNPICEMCHFVVKTVRESAPVRPTIPEL